MSNRIPFYKIQEVTDTVEIKKNIKYIKRKFKKTFIFDREICGDELEKLHKIMENNTEMWLKHSFFDVSNTHDKTILAFTPKNKKSCEPIIFWVTLTYA